MGSQPRRARTRAPHNNATPSVQPQPVAPATPTPTSSPESKPFGLILQIIGAVTAIFGVFEKGMDVYDKAVKFLSEHPSIIRFFHDCLTW